MPVKAPCQDDSQSFFFWARCCLGQVLGGAPFSQRFTLIIKHFPRSCTVHVLNGGTHQQSVRFTVEENIHTFHNDSGQLWTRSRNLSDSHTTRVTGAFNPSKLISSQTQQHRTMQSSQNLLHREPKCCLDSVKNRFLRCSSLL